MGISRSTFYAAASAKRKADAVIFAEIRAITDVFECYGYRRVGAELRRRGRVVNSKKVRRLMRENDLNLRRRRRFAKTTDSDHGGPIFPFVAKDFEVHSPDQLGSRISPMSRSRSGSSPSRSSWMRGRDGSSATRSAGRPTLASLSEPYSGRSHCGGRCLAACFIATGARNTPRRSTGRCLASAASSAR